MEDPRPRPIIFLDVDGVLTPLGASEYDLPSGYVHLALASGESAILKPDHGIVLRALAKRADLVWATTWGDAANEVIGALLELPALPVATHKRPKLPWLLAYAADRPFVWLDDDVPPMDRIRIGLRDERIPTRWIQIDPNLGLTEEDLAAVRRFLDTVG